MEGNHTVEQLIDLSLENGIILTDAPDIWTDAKQSLPPFDLPVLVLLAKNKYTSRTDDYNNMQVCYLRDSGRQGDPDLDWANTDCAFCFEYVTHWMPLPMPPIK